MYLCSHCNAKYKYNHGLKRHLLKVHNEMTVRSDNSYVHTCALCEKRFISKKNIARHERLIHGINKSAKNNQCPLCDFTALSKKDFYEHIETAHNIPIIREETHFQNMNSFIEWKEEIEKETYSKYKKASGNYSGKNNNRRFYFICHRSGHYVSTANKKKNLKIQGSRKINGMCPSSIIVKETEDSKCAVKFIQTHVGHQNEIHHLNLTINERASVAKEIANKVPFDEILRRFKDPVSNSSPERIHLLKKKDLYNIEREFNLTSCVVRKSGHTCTLCEKHFTNKKNIALHERLVHGIGKSTKKNKCPLCNFTSSKKDIYIHIQTNHGIPIINEEIKFQNINSFIEWKDKIEKETCSKYKTASENYNGKGNSRRHYFKCQQTGQYDPTENGEKHLKIQGREEMNGMCPSGIQVNEAEDGTCVVKFIETHVGHQNDVCNMNLTINNMELIANKVPFDEVLQVNSISNSPTERTNLHKIKDMYNIDQEFNFISCAVRQNDELTNVKANENNSNWHPRDTPSSEHVELVLINESKEEIKNKYLNLLESINDIVELDIVNKSFDTLKAKLKAVQTSKKDLSIKKRKIYPPRKRTIEKKVKQISLVHISTPSRG